MIRMYGFPLVDPIPLPAPVWLFKALHITTMALHFTAVQIMLGSLILATMASMRRSATTNPVAPALAGRLPIVMTYVINLGVPPLLFSQVLYGRALYTSSVLIGFWWIAVIPLLIAAYWLLYQFAARIESGRLAWPLGLSSLLLVGLIARIYTSNMTLMLKPEVWPGMYERSGGGMFLPTPDPALEWRYLYMLAGGLMMGGVWLLWLAASKSFDMPGRKKLAFTGGLLASVLAIVELIAGLRVYAVQPATVRTQIGQHPFFGPAAYVWMAGLAAVALVGLWSVITRRASGLERWAAALAGFLAVAGMTIYRDGIRDLTLLSKGFDVWQRNVDTNWPVVILFLVLFVAALGAVGWLISVAARAKTPMAKTA